MIVFVARIIRNRLCIVYGFFYYFFQKSLFAENYFLIAAINLTTRGPLYTCLVQISISKIRKAYPRINHSLVFFALSTGILCMDLIVEKSFRG